MRELISRWRVFLPGPPPTYELLQFSNSNSGLLVRGLLFVEVRGYCEIGVPLRVVAVDAVEVSMQVADKWQGWGKYLITVWGSP